MARGARILTYTHQCCNSGRAEKACTCEKTSQMSSVTKAPAHDGFVPINARKTHMQEPCSHMRGETRTYTSTTLPHAPSYMSSTCPSLASQESQPGTRRALPLSHRRSSSSIPSPPLPASPVHPFSPATISLWDRRALSRNENTQNTGAASYAAVTVTISLRDFDGHQVSHANVCVRMLD
jgi:hypothetical protein